MDKWLLFFGLIIFSVNGFAREINCDSDGDSQAYKDLLDGLGINPLCALSTEYEAAFRVVVAPPAGDPTGVTVYQSPIGELNAVTHSQNGERQSLSEAQYIGILTSFQSLSLFELKSHEELMAKECDLMPEGCPMGFDGTRMFIEASYGASKRTVERWGSLVDEGASYVEVEYLNALNQLYGLMD
ncbi:hypothetical protein [Marinimicrobium sp. ABcell2]|uniref:hypothetical protein n=1 Tax=Marinimicrobium sp. ABcell2 TaxID=3069751 RepID=UPI0027B02CF2|nr:hypothetical protein [Marinimicrobium sp. ABcell2]MDQ2075800.1 hypothetical protein [Marinimicrobium sp. ABcell2]